MLKFIKHNMETISGIEIYPLISLGIFTVFFALVLYGTIKMRKTHVSTLENLPLNDN